jgi:OOP family OmpA-OmpF porin
MRILICAAVATVVAFAGAPKAYADAEPGQGYFSLMWSYVDDDKKRGLEDTKKAGQMSFGYALSDALNIELFLSQASVGASSPLANGQNHLGAGFDLQGVFRRAEDFSPYVHIGAGYLEIEPQGSGAARDGAAYSAGLGFYLDLFSTNIALRGEWKHRIDYVAEVDRRKDNLFSLGLQIPFGNTTPKWSDSDGDGVEDGSDRCPNTPAGARVDAYGCELDSDGDGVKDSKDQCPGTPRGMPVDEYGCPNDSDGDGVTDDRDECPGTPAGAEVDAKGCELDDDGDGVINRLDECPGTPAGTPVDKRGCPIEGDYVLKGVNFESNSDRLMPGARPILDQVVATLLKYPEIKFEIQGHTDSDGSAQYNEGLSSRRAQTVHDYLASKGVDESRMTVRGYGESQPIADNSTAAGKAQNRRVVLSVEER